MWFKQGFFCHSLFGNMSDSFELVEGMEELYFGADQVSIPESDDSAGRAQYYVESYVYEPEDGENAPGLGSNSEVMTGEASTAQCFRLLHRNFRQVFAHCCLPSWQKS